MPKRQWEFKGEKNNSGLVSWKRNICQDLDEFRHANMIISVGLRSICEQEAGNFRAGPTNCSVRLQRRLLKGRANEKSVPPTLFFLGEGSLRFANIKKEILELYSPFIIPLQETFSYINLTLFLFQY